MIEMMAGNWVIALGHADLAVGASEGDAGDRVRKKISHAFRAATLHALGRVAEAGLAFMTANSFEDAPPLYAYSGVLEAEYKALAGRVEEAEAQTQTNMAKAVRRRWSRMNAICEVILGRFALRADPGLARKYLQAARRYVARSGTIEVTLRCHQLATEIAKRDRAFPVAVAEALDGIHLADSCGFGRWSIDLRTELARVHLAAGSPRDAVEPAEWVLKRSREGACQYTWGASDALHLLGVAHARLHDREKARDYLGRAVEQRRPLEHSGLAETEEELRRLG